VYAPASNRLCEFDHCGKMDDGLRLIVGKDFTKFLAVANIACLQRGNKSSSPLTMDAELAGILGIQYSRKGHDQDLDVERQRPIIGVKSVARDTLSVRCRTAAADLP